MIKTVVISNFQVNMKIKKPDYTIIDLDIIPVMKENKYQEGEIFAISLSTEEDGIKQFKPPYVFGRLIAINPSKDNIVEIFQYYGDMMDDIEMIKSSGRLFQPISVVNYARKKRWRRIYSDPKYCYEDGKFSVVRLSLGSLIWEEGKTRLKKKEDGEIEDYIIYDPIQVEARIRKALGLDKDNLNFSLLQTREENVVRKEIDEKIDPFYWLEWDGEERVSVNLDCVLNYKQELLERYSKKGFIGNGYDWDCLANIYLDKMNLNVKDVINFDSESSLFSAHSNDKEALKEFIFGFQEICEKEDLLKELLSQARRD